MVLWGRYIEKLENKLVNRFPLQISYRGKNVFHKIYKLLSKKVVTLNIMFSKENKWGYKVDNNYIDNIDYRNKKNSKSLDNKAICVKSLYKSTYKGNAFDIDNSYLIKSEDDKFYYVIDNTGHEFNLSKTETAPYYYFGDYFSKL